MLPAFHLTSEYRRIRDKVKIGIEDVNDAVAILRDGHTPGQVNDSIEVAYTPSFARRFQEAVAQVEKDFTESVDLANGWFSSVGASISENHVRLSQLRDAEGGIRRHLERAQHELKKTVENVKTVAARVLDDQEHLAQTRQRVEDAQKRLDEKLAEQKKIRKVAWALFWLPVISIALAIINATVTASKVQEERAASEAVRGQAQQDQDALNENKESLESLESRVRQYERQLRDFNDELSRTVAEQKDLSLTQDQLGLVRVKAAACMHAVGGAWASANNMGNMLSLTNVADAVHGLVQALSEGPPDIFVGQLAALDRKGIQDIDHKVTLIAKSRSLLSLSF